MTKNSDSLNTHGILLDFGKHKGEPWTRVPVGYLKWILNEMSPDDERYKLAESELNRRGDTMPMGIAISNHAIDKASLRVRKAWHTDRGQDEGLYSWLVRISTEALKRIYPIITASFCRQILKTSVNYLETP